VACSRLEETIKMKWKIFSKKNKEEVDADKKLKKENKEEALKVKDQIKYPYRVYLKDITGSSTKKHKPFGVERFIDVDNSTVSLFNPNFFFKEIFPEDSDEFKIYQIEEVTEKIKELEVSLAKEIKKDDPLINRKNIEYDLNIFKNRLRSLQLQGRGSYMNYDDDGTPYFVFRRKGNYKFPEFDNVELDTIYTPSETKIKQASELLDMKNEKYSKFKKNLNNITMTLFIVLMIFGGLLVWWSLQLNALSNESAITLINAKVDQGALYCMEKYGQAGENFYDASVAAKNFTETIVKDLYKPSAVIGGVSPR